MYVFQGHTAPELDRIQDLTLVSASYDPVTAFTFVTLTRPLNTGDARDDVAIEVVLYDYITERVYVFKGIISLLSSAAWSYLWAGLSMTHPTVPRTPIRTLDLPVLPWCPQRPQEAIVM